MGTGQAISADGEMCWLLTWGSDEDVVSSAAQTMPVRGACPKSRDERENQRQGGA